MKNNVVLLFVIFIYSCKSEKNEVVESKTMTANAIVNKTIEVSGRDRFDNAEIKFDFRTMHYSAKRNNGDFVLSRIAVKDEDSIVDVLTNTGFERFINDEFIKLEDSMLKKYAASVNSVHYFSVLPFGLNDKAVNKVLLGEEKIKNVLYYKLQVTFIAAGGGEDYEDVFVYWVNKQTFKSDYIAYSYNEDDGIGLRFRAAYNERFINGLRFVDYNNYKAVNTSSPLLDLGMAYENNQLKLVSKIELNNVKVTLVDD